MAQEKTKDRLGKGLAALLGDDYRGDKEAFAVSGAQMVPIEFIKPNPNNPRQSFEKSDLEDLTNSIREKGLLQPIVVRRSDGGSFEIIAGERRWRAAQAAQLHEVPVFEREVSDSEALEIAIIENVQRTDLNPLEEAYGYHRLMKEFGYTQEQLSTSIGKSRSHLANTLRLVNLPEKLKDYLSGGKITAGHARALLGHEKAEQLADQVITKGLNVRQTEALVKAGDAPVAKKFTRLVKDADTLALEKDIAAALGLKADIRHKGKRGGELRITYKTLEQLDHVCSRLVSTPDSDT